MTLSEKNTITECINKIKGAKSIKIGRAADLVWIAMKGIDGKDYALHMQTFFRFCNIEEVLITDMDKYQPISPMTETENLNWDVKGNNLFDKWCDDFNKNFSDNIVIKSIEINNFGDLTIKFSNSITLNVFVDTTSNDECWRFFVWHGKERHLVITGRGIQCREDNVSE